MLLLLAACASSTDPGLARAHDAPVDVVPVDTADTAACVDAPPVVLNELVAANLHGLADTDGDTSDWLELALAPAAAAAELAGWSLTDGSATWILPAVTLQPGGTLLVWASGKDRADPTAELHASFSLDDGGEDVSLLAPSGCVADAVETGRLYADVAYGRAPGGSWVYFLVPTPGAPNTTESRPGFAPMPTLTPTPGFYADPVTVTVVPPAGDTARYTLDGSVPDEAAPLYERPLHLDATAQPVVVRAVAFEDGLWPSRIATATYSADPAILAGVRVISLTMNPPDLWDTNTGIYVLGPTYEPNYPYFGANFWELWERDVHVEIFGVDGTLELAQDAGIQIAGGYSRAFDQRNFELVARSGYGPDTFADAVFPNEDIPEFHKLYLRNGGDWCGTQIVDASVQAMFRDADDRRVPTVDAQAYTPTLVYLNGEFWGLYELKERLDEFWVADHHGEDPDALDRVKLGWTHDANWELEEGTWDAFDALNTLVDTSDLAEPDAWAQFTSMVDVDNFASTVVVQGWIGNTDWWWNNLRMWRPWRDGGLWRWMAYDFGHGWPDWHYDHLAVSTSDSWPGLPIAAALRNPTFRDRFVNIHADFLNTTLAGRHAEGVVRQLAAEVRPVMQRQRDRWCSGAAMSAWEGQVSYAETFAANRASVVDADLMAHLGLAGHAALSLAADPVDAGTFHLAAVEVTPPYTGAYYQGVPVTVTALPAPGWVFDGWSDGTTAATVTLEMAGDTAVTARFHR